MSISKRAAEAKVRKGQGGLSSKTFITVTGANFAQIDKQIDELFGVMSLNQKKRVIKRIFTQTTTDLKKTARKNRRATRARKSNTRNAVMRSLGVENLRKYLGVRIGFRRNRGRSGALAHLLDQGTNPRITKGGRFTGRVKPSHFWTNAIKTEGPNLTNNLHEVIQDSFKHAAARYNRKYKPKT